MRRALFICLTSLLWLPISAPLWAQGAACQVPVLAPGASKGRPPVCMDAFYEVLGTWGTWIETDRYGHLFCPDPDRFEPDFRPYARGHWVMSEAGWTFVGEHPTSWVTDHYGRWVEAGLGGCPWGWVPGDVWSPAWVEFHVGDGVIAWRPAPFDGVPVQLRVPQGTRLQQLRIGPSPPPSQSALVAVPDSDFAARDLGDVTLSGPDYVKGVANLALLPDARAGFRSQERLAVVTQMLEARGLLPGGLPPGEAPEPARRPARSKVAGAVKKGKSEGAPAPRPGDAAPGMGKVPWAGDQNQGGFTRPGPPGGVKVFEWGKPKAPVLPPKR